MESFIPVSVNAFFSTKEKVLFFIQFIYLFIYFPLVETII